MIKYQIFTYSSVPLPLPLECPSQEADIEIQQNSIEAEIAAEINLLPQPEHHQIVEEITLDAEIAITARVPVKVTILRQTNRPFSIPVQKIELQLMVHPQELKFYN